LSTQREAVAGGPASGQVSADPAGSAMG
jgi:hypothetical protein